MKRLLLFWSLCFLLACSTSQVEVADYEIVTTRESNQPLATPTDDPYPIGMPTPAPTSPPPAYVVEMPTTLPPTNTPSVPPTIRPTSTSTATPTATPIPTPLTLPQSANAIWVETFSFNVGLPDGVTSRSTIYEVDPRDMANRRVIVEIPDMFIDEAVLSPDGNRIALRSWLGDPYQGHRPEIWIYNIVNDSLEQITANGFNMIWDSGGQRLAYTTYIDETHTMQVYDLQDRQSSLLLEGDHLTEHIHPLYWSEDDVIFYYVRADTGDGRNEGENQDEFYSMSLLDGSAQKFRTYQNTYFNLLAPSEVSPTVYMSIQQNGTLRRVVLDLTNATETEVSEGYGQVEWLTSTQFIGRQSISATIYDFSSQSVIADYTFENSVWRIDSASPDGKWMYIQFAKKGWNFWHFDSDSFVPLPYHENAVVVMAGWR